MNQPSGAGARQRVLRFEVPDAGSFDRLVREGAPFGSAEGELQVEAFRDVYYDTRTGDLERRGALVRVRLREQGPRELLVDVWEDDQPRGRRQRLESPLPEEDALFEGGSDAARRVRALVEPKRLRPALEVEVLRRWREIDGGEEPLRVAYDAITVRRGELSADLYEIELRTGSGENERLRGVVERLESEHGLRVTLSGRAARARDAIEERQAGTLAMEIRAARIAAVVPLRDGRIGFLPRENGWTVPSGPGHGTSACRTVLRETLGRGAGRIRLLDRFAGAGARPAVEVWLADLSGTPADEDRPLEWLEVERALDAAGSERLRDTTTLSALNAVARADLPPIGSVPTDTAPADDPMPRIEVEEELEDSEPQLPPEHLLNMELSRQAFDERILVMAEDPEVPLLERVRFLSMFGSRQDDFFMTRVAGFKDQLASGRDKRTLDGLSAAQQLQAIGIRARRMSRRAYRLLVEDLLPSLQAEGIHVLRWSELDEDERAELRSTYARHVEAVLTPLASDPSHPFPHIRNLRPAIAALLKLPESDSPRFAAIELPGDLPRFVPVRGGRQFVPLREVILAGLPETYPGVEVVEAHAFRVTRSANLRLGGKRVQDVLQAVEEAVNRRPFRYVVRLEVDRSMPERMRAMLLRELQHEAEERVVLLGAEDVYTVDWEIDLAALAEIADIDDPSLHFAPVEREDPFEFDGPLLDELERGDRMVRFPEHSFEATVGRFLREASQDDDVVSLKVTLYRTDPSSPVVESLIEASRRGKEVAVLVELKASFDEVRNIQWARELESVGARVVFSPPQYKVHAKMALVVRQRDGEAPRRYAYIGTGNLNARTAASYVDVGVLTADPEVCAEVGDLFNLLTGYAPRVRFQELLVAPFTMRQRMLELIERETAHAREGRPALIRAQFNGLSDRRIIAALYRAARSGVRIEMAVREICCLRPGVPGLSDNIRIVSLLGRFLQHARIFHFANGGEDEYYIGSADLRPRNLAKRVELAAPVTDPRHREILDGMLSTILHHPDAWVLQADGRFARDDERVGPLRAGTAEPVRERSLRT